MGFSPNLFEFFVGPDLRNIDLSKTVVLSKDRRSVVGIKSPNVLKIARKHYNCPYIKSVPFENDGGEGSMGAHWERSTLMNEMMTASEITNSRMSEFTLALMQDSGWYISNFEYSEHFTYGKNVGCRLNFDLDLDEFVRKGGNIANLTYMKSQCSEKFSRGCFYDYTHQGLCLKDSFMVKNENNMLQD
jgi:Leishmanolysin